ncbi:30S ribosomal protein S1, chloroplastic [Linum perenne]
MPAIFTVSHGRSLAGLSSIFFSPNSPLISPKPSLTHFRTTHKLSQASSSGRLAVNGAEDSNGGAVIGDVDKQARRNADWNTARKLKASGSVHVVKVVGYNNGGLIVRFHSLLGFVPFPQLSPAHLYKGFDEGYMIRDVAATMVDSLISVKIIAANDGNRSLIFSEREVAWDKYSKGVVIGDVFEGRVGLVEDYAAFVHLRCPDGMYHLDGLVRLSEISWDVTRDARDVLTTGDKVKVRVCKIDRKNTRFELSIKQLQDDPLLQTLDKVLPQDDLVNDASHSDVNGDNTIVEPLPGLTEILKELLLEEGIEDVRITREGFEKRVVSQDLQLWLSNAVPKNGTCILLARAGRQVQEIQLTTTLDQKGIKKVLQHVLERVP